MLQESLTYSLSGKSLCPAGWCFLPAIGDTSSPLQQHCCTQPGSLEDYEAVSQPVFAYENWQDHSTSDHSKSLCLGGAKSCFLFTQKGNRWSPLTWKGTGLCSAFCSRCTGVVVFVSIIRTCKSCVVSCKKAQSGYWALKGAVEIFTLKTL